MYYGHLGTPWGSLRLSCQKKSEIILGVAMMKQIMKHITVGKAFSSIENASDMTWPGGQKFSG